MDNPVVLGVDFGGSKVAVAAADVAGARLGSATLAVRPADSAQRDLRSWHGGRSSSCWPTVAPDGSLAAVGVATFGIPRSDGIDLAPTIAGWEQLALGDRLHLAFPGIPVVLATM